MGLFSSKYVHNVGTTVTRVVEDKNVFSSVKTSAMQALFTGDDLVDTVLENSLSSFANTSRQMYQYGKDKYHYGLPSGEIFYNTQGRTEVQAILNALEGQPVLIQYCRLSAMNGVHMARTKLMDEHGYNPQTNVLGNLTVAMNAQVYLKNLILELPAGSQSKTFDAESLEIWGTAPTAGYYPDTVVLSSNSALYAVSAPVFLSNVTTPRVRVEYRTTRTNRLNYDASSEVVTGYFNIPVPGISSNADYFQAAYTVGGETKYWSYQQGLGQYPALDNLQTDGAGATAVFAEFFPNVYFRLNKSRLNTDKTSAAYKTSRKLLKYAGMEYDILADAVNDNPDIGDVQSAFLTFGVPADSEDPDELAYLYSFFDRAYEAQNGNGYSSAPSAAHYLLTHATDRSFLKTEDSTTQALVIKDGAFKMALTNKGLNKTRKVGKIGEIGEVRRSSGNIREAYSANIGWDSDGIQYRNIPYRLYQKQVSLNLYDEIQVIDLTMKYVVAGEYFSTLGDSNDEICLVPLDKDIAGELKFNDRERLLIRSMHFVFNSYVIQKIKWYQQGWFADLIQIVGFILTVMALGSDGGFFASLSTAIATQSLVTVIKVILLKLILPALLTKIAFTVFVKVVGQEIAFLAALIAAALGMVQYLKDVGAAVSETVVKFLNLASGLASAVSSQVMEDFNDLLGDMREFNLLNENRVRELDTASTLFDRTPLLSPLVIFGESPDQFYQRTVHSGNIGTLLLDDVHLFVDRSLQLPSFADSVKGYSYATST